MKKTIIVIILTDGMIVLGFMISVNDHTNFNVDNKRKC